MISVAVMTLLSISASTAVSCAAQKIVPSKIDLKKVNRVSEDTSSSDPMVVNDPRKKINFQEVGAKYPQINSIGRVELANDKSHLTGTLVTKCHVLINLHLLQNVTRLASDAGSLPANKTLLALSDAQLSNPDVSRVQIGFIPNGNKEYQNGYKVSVTGRFVKTGRVNFSKYNYEENIPTNEDWALIKIDNAAALENFQPIEIASEEEIGMSKNILAVGYPKQLIGRDGQNEYYQKCEAQVVGDYSHNCIATQGNSSSPLMSNWKTTKPTNELKINGIVSRGRYAIDAMTASAVPANSFRAAIEEAKKQGCN